MEKIDRMYFINLEKRPDRNQHILDQCRKHDIPFSKLIRFEAIDGLTFQFTEDHLRLFKNCDFFRTLKMYRENNMPEKQYQMAENITKKVMGNQLSHYSILYDIVNHGYDYAIILQDDAVFNQGIVEYIDHLLEHMPEDTEIMNIGANKYADGADVISWDFEKDSEETIAREYVNDYVCKLKETMNPCSLAYIVTKKGAKHLLEYFSTVGFLKATDFNFNHYLTVKDIFYSSRKIMVTTRDFGSDIF
jgi:glycosyl transferase family 25